MLDNGKNSQKLYDITQCFRNCLIFPLKKVAVLIVSEED